MYHVSYLISSYLSFLICKVGIKVFTSSVSGNIKWDIPHKVLKSMPSTWQNFNKFTVNTMKLMVNNNDSGQFPKMDTMYHLSLINKLFFRIQKATLSC